MKWKVTNFLFHDIKASLNVVDSTKYCWESHILKYQSIYYTGNTLLFAFNNN